MVKLDISGTQKRKKKSKKTSTCQSGVIKICHETQECCSLTLDFNSALTLIVLILGGERSQWLEGNGR